MTAAWEHKFINFAPGRRVHCVEAGSGPAVVYLPGNGCDVEDAALIAGAIAARHRFVGIDLPGRAPTDWPDEPFDFTTDLLKYLGLVFDALKIVENVVIGHSMGGMLALHLAHRAPEYVRGLILIEGFVTLPTHYRVVAPESARPIRMAPAVEADFRRRREANQRWERAHPVFHESFWASQQEHDARPWADELTMPILFMLGDMGQAMPAVEDVDRWRRHLELEGVAGLRVAPIRAAGHWAMLDQPERVAAKVVPFLDEVWA